MEAVYNKFAVYEPRCEINNERSWVIIKGGQTITYTPYPATSFSNSNFNFVSNPPGKQNILDRVCIIEVPVEIDFTAVAVGTNRVIQSGLDAFRAYPVSSVTSTLTAKINGYPVSVEISEIVHLLSRFHTPLENLRTYASLSLQMDDNYQDYRDATTAGGTSYSNNPLAVYGENTTQVPRGAYPMNISTNTTTSAKVSATLREYIILPPFIFDGHQAGGLTNLDTFQMDFILNPNLNRIWSRSPAHPVTLSSMTVNFFKPTLWLGWITPRLTQPIPRLMSYPYFQISKYVTSQAGIIPGGTITPGTSVDLKSDVIQFNSIPRKIYIFAKESNTIINANLVNSISLFPDVFLKINNISISWDNIDGVLSGANAHNLWELSVANGLKLSWTEFNGITQFSPATTATAMKIIGLTGSILCIELGKDIGLRDNQAEGALDKVNFQISRMNVTNINQYTNITPDLYILAIYDGVLEIFDNSARSYIGVINASDILNAPVSHEVSYNQLEKVYGGDFFSKFKDIAGRVVKGLRDTKAISNVLGSIPNPYAQIGSKIARSFGLGEGARAGVLAGCMNCPPGRCICMQNEGNGGVLIGGRIADPIEMKKRLKKMRGRK